MDRDRAPPTHPLVLHLNAQDLGIPCRSPPKMGGTQTLEPSPAASPGVHQQEASVRSRANAVFTTAPSSHPIVIFCCYSKSGGSVMWHVRVTPEVDNQGIHPSPSPRRGFPWTRFFLRPEFIRHTSWEVCKGVTLTLWEKGKGWGRGTQSQDWSCPPPPGGKMPFPLLLRGWGRGVAASLALNCFCQRALGV